MTADAWFVTVRAVSLWISALGAAFVVVGLTGVLRWSGDRPAAATAGWYPDPCSRRARRRRWDGDTWTSEVADGGAPADRGRRFRGRFWGWAWVLPLVAAVVVVVVGGGFWLRTRDDGVLLAMSVVAMALGALAFYRFVDRQLALHEVVSGRTVLAAALAGVGTTILVAAPLDDLIITHVSLSAGLAMSGPVEEMTKLLVPIAAFLLAGLRSPRAGIAMGLASGFGFAVMEAGLYAHTVPLGGSPDPCTGGALPSPSTTFDFYEQINRLVLAEPLHWLATGFAVTVIWRQWHRGGPRLTVPAVGAVLLVMAAHSSFDTSTLLGCGGAGGAAVVYLVHYGVPFGLYLLLRAAARRSLPPALVGRVSRGWHPRRLAGEEAPATVPVEPARDGEHPSVSA